VWCSSVATPFNVPSLCLSLLFAFSPFVLTFAMGPQAQLSTIRKPGKTIFFTKEICQLKKKKKKKEKKKAECFWGHHKLAPTYTSTFILSALTLN